MPEFTADLAELLLHEAFPRIDRCGRKILMPLVLLIGVVVLLSWVPCTSRWERQHAAIQVPTIAMVDRFRPDFRDVQRFQPFPTFSNRFKSFPTASSSWPSKHGTVSVNPAHAIRSVSMPLHGQTWVQPVPQQVESDGKNPKLGPKARPLGRVDVLDARVTTLKKHPLVAILHNSQLAFGDLAVLVLVGRLLDTTLESLGRKFLQISHIRDQVFRTIRQYGVAGIISVIVGTVSYWLLVLLPASAYMYHSATSAWLPTLSDPKSVAAFGKILGGVFLCTHLPPIEAARWAWVLSMVPWFQERLPPVLRGAGD